MDVNSLLNTVTRQRRDCDLNLGPSAPEFSALTTLFYRETETRGNKYKRMQHHYVSHYVSLTLLTG